MIQRPGRFNTPRPSDLIQLDDDKVPDFEFNNICFVLTGKMTQPRYKIIATIHKYNGKTRTNMNHMTNYLVVGSTRQGKLTKKIKEGLEIRRSGGWNPVFVISEERFWRLVIYNEKVKTNSKKKGGLVKNPSWHLKDAYSDFEKKLQALKPHLTSKAASVMILDDIAGILNKHRPK